MIELSIVLVIIGLIVGGILGGKTLIRQAELKSVVEDATKYTEAAYKFKDKYQYFPGDMPDATTIWGARAGCPFTTAAPPATCNGNGNEKVEWTAIGSIPAGQGVERVLFWQHLAQEGLISGSYTGYGPSGAEGEALVGTNLPASRIDGVGFAVMYYDARDDNANGNDDESNSFFWGKADILIQVSKKRTDITGMYLDWPAFTILEAQGMDLKFDDGRPNFGKIHATQRYALNPESYYCTTDWSMPGGIAYEADSAEGIKCHLAFLDIGR